MHTKNYISLFLALSLLFQSQVKAQDLNPADWNHLTGYWKFQNNKDLLQATVGNKLKLVGTHSVVQGPSYGDTAVRIAVGSYYDCSHNIAPNGGGDSVNQYTLMFDFKILSLNRWHTFFQTDTTNSNDGECFIRPNSGSNPGRIGTATTKYTTDSVLPNKWYRLMISVNLGHFYRYFLNGQLILEGDTQDMDGRFALTPKILFFADDNQEDDTIDIASIAIFDTCLSSADIAKIGTIEPCIANPPKVHLGNDTLLCDYQNLNLSAGIGYSKYQWSTGGGLPFLSVQSSNIGLGKSNVWVKVTDKNGCTGTDTIAIDFKPSPLIELGPDTSFCEGLQLQLIGNVDTTFIFEWFTLQDEQLLSTLATYSVDSSANILLKAHSLFGCMAQDSIHVTVFPTPEKPAINLVNNNKICQGDSVILQASKTYSAYEWSNAATSFQIILLAPQVMRLRITDVNHCQSTWSDSVDVIFNPLPIKPHLTLSADSIFCDGDSLLITAPQGYYYYLWMDGNGGTTRISKMSSSYTLMVSDSNHCNAYSNTVNTYKRNPPAKPKIAVVGNAEPCIGDTMILTLNESFSGYHWSDNTNTKENKIHQSGSYTVQITDTFGCRSRNSDTVNIIFYDYPAKPVITSGTNDSLTCNQKVDHYKWYTGSNLINDTTQTIKANLSAFYAVMTANKQCWSEKSEPFYHKNAGSPALQHPSELFQLAPNPAHNVIVIQLSPTQSEELPIFEVYNSTGNSVLTQIEIDEITTHQIKLNLENLASGIYTLKILYHGNLSERKFLKH